MRTRLVLPVVAMLTMCPALGCTVEKTEIHVTPTAQGKETGQTEVPTSRLLPGLTMPAGSELFLAEAPGDHNVEEGVRVTMAKEAWNLPPGSTAGDLNASIRSLLSGWEEKADPQSSVYSCPRPCTAVDHSTAISHEFIVSFDKPGFFEITEMEMWLTDERDFQAYRSVESISADSSLSESQKAQRVRQIGLEYEVLSTIVRYVPVWDSDKGSFVTFDQYARELGADLGGDSPLARDPVGATIAIFADPSPQTIRAMLGIPSP
jgi:hypothetical protein